MSKAILVHGAASKYDDEPGEYYHFPKRYLARMQETVGDWIVYFTPVKDKSTSRENRGSYFATAQVQTIRPDPRDVGLFYADIKVGTFLSFANPVPRKYNGDFLENKLNGKGVGANTGHALQAVRLVSDAEFARIVNLGLVEERVELPREEGFGDKTGFLEEVREDFVMDQPREIITALTNRKRRETWFRNAILNAYEKKCAVTGWSFVNGGGRAEVEAAHIKPVEANGPDIVNNGIALSGTVHWMFDRGLIAIGDQHEILISRKVNDVDGLKSILNSTGKLVLPRRPEFVPHVSFIKWHRQNHGF